MTICVPVRDMKNTNSFVSLVENENDVTVTKNGYEAIHCLSVKEYQLLQEEKAKAKLLTRVLLAEKEFANGEYSDYNEIASSAKAKYGL